MRRLHSEHRALGLEQNALRGTASQQLSHRVAMPQADDDEFDVRVLRERRDLVYGITPRAD